MANPICHFEICVNDRKKAVEFYGGLFDWKIETDEGMDYSMVSTGEDLGGGIFQVQGEMKPYTAVYIKVEDIDGTIDKAVALGAHEIQRKKQISAEHGFYGMFADPDGNVIGLWSKE